MPETENLGTFFNENKKLVKEYFETKLEIFKLRLIRAFSGLAGHLLWVIVLLFLLSLLTIFLGMVTGFWLSEITGSYTRGFGLTALIILVLVLLVAVFRKSLFINPLIKVIMKKTAKDAEDEIGENEKQ